MYKKDFRSRLAVNRTDRISPKEGSVLLIVLIAIVLLSLSAYTFSILMITEDESARLMGRQIQSRYLVESGVDYVRLFMSQDPATIREAGGVWDNPSFVGAEVLSEVQVPGQIGRFTIVTARIDDDGFVSGTRFGLQDESTKLNLNTLLLADQFLPGAARSLLMALPNMTDEIADAILDWMDPDDEQRELGTEAGYYATLSPAYPCKNAPMDSIEELLLVRGVTPSLLFGLDHNHNGLVDPDELVSESANSVEPDMQLGWANYLTLFSKESNLNREGLPRININNPDLIALEAELRSVLDQRWTNFILAYRINGPYSGTDEVDDDGNYLELDLDETPTADFDQILDLIDARTTIVNLDAEEEEKSEFVIESPVNTGNLAFTLPVIMDNLTTMQSESIPGRINIMQAPRRVLAGIPGIDDEIIDQIIQKREYVLDDPDGADRLRNYSVWILAEQVVTLEQMKTMFPFVCAGGDVYRAEVVGYHDDGVGSSRAEVVLDTTVPLPRILFWRDKTHLQNGFTLDSWGTGLLDPGNY